MSLSNSECKRLKKMMKYEKLLMKEHGYKYIAGVDEAGRGPLAGPVVSCACILLNGYLIEGLNDSKKIYGVKRRAIYKKLIASKDVIFSYSIVDSKMIDELNILNATLLSMKKAVDNLSKKPDYVLFDGNFSPKIKYPSKCLIKGDMLSVSIAAASIIAKCTRDKYMEQLHDKWPLYGFKDHKGYGTKRHIEAIEKFGICEIHRRSFAPIKAKI